jgi:coenzyme F420-reducing hydrogenase alpha subunit
MTQTRTIKVEALTRVEGEGGLHVRLNGDVVEDVQLTIYEPPRFFEAFLRGRPLEEVPDVTARICGICPVAYQMSSAHALESIFGILPERDDAIRLLRRIFYCGEWIESHALHVFFLNLPDFMGRSSAIQIAETHPAIVERAIRVRRTGNELLALLGGRAMHPVGAAVGGWHRAPRERDLAEMLPRLDAAREDCIESARWMKRELKFPEFRTECEFIALRHEGEYPMNEGRIASTAGWEVDGREWEGAIEERQVEHSNAYHAVLRRTGEPYFVGALARFNLNRERLTPAALELAEELELRAPIQNPYFGILVRTVEMVFCFEEARRLIEAYRRPAECKRAFEPRAGEGAWTTEAPRGILYHRYRVNENGTVAEARIVPPTSQNQAQIERDLRALVEKSLARGDHDLSHDCEFMIRNYDPCISCATHFLSFRIDR